MNLLLDFDVTCMILGGGQGARLHPLTKDRAKPAVPVAGKYRLIDIPISNCLHAGMNRIYVLTQFNSTSLHRHIHHTYRFDRYSRGFIEILAAQQTPQLADQASWYQGTADAVRKNLVRLRDAGGQDVLILSGDQIYQLDFQELMSSHRGQSNLRPTEVTIAALLVPASQVSEFGILRIDSSRRVVEFVEKPKGDAQFLRPLEAPAELVGKFDMPAGEGPWFLANMGIYAFQLEVLEEALRGTGADFGREILPALLDKCQVRAHLFHGYWEDLGTIRSFHEANIALGGPNPRFSFYSPDKPLFTRARPLPASTFQEVTVVESLLADGCQIESARIERSVIGLRSVIGRGVKITNSYLMGADYYEGKRELRRNRGSELPDIGIGAGTIIENAIVDKNARVGKNVKIVNREGHENYEDGRVIIREGIVVVPRQGVIPDGYSI